MSSKPVIAILGGTGKEGRGLAARWAHAGYRVIIGSRQTEKAETAAGELNISLGIETIQGFENAEAARQADICVLTVVQAAHQAALESLKDALQGKMLIDATARVDYKQAAAPPPPSAARNAQTILGPGTTVVAAFQNVPASTLKKNLDEPVDSDVLICADDLEAAEKAVALAKDAGMQAFYSGGLDNAFVVEGITALLIAINKHYGGHATLQVSGLDQ